MKATVLQQFEPIFAEIKSRFDERPSVADGLICKQGFYMNSLVLKLQKASWTNDPINPIMAKSEIKAGYSSRYGSLKNPQPGIEQTTTSTHSNSAISRAIRSPAETSQKISETGSRCSRNPGLM